jgi:hypothetical protein
MSLVRDGTAASTLPIRDNHSKFEGLRRVSPPVSPPA